MAELLQQLDNYTSITAISLSFFVWNEIIDYSEVDKFFISLCILLAFYIAKVQLEKTNDNDTLSRTFSLVSVRFVLKFAFTNALQSGQHFFKFSDPVLTVLAIVVTVMIFIYIYLWMHKRKF